MWLVSVLPASCRQMGASLQHAIRPHNRSSGSADKMPAARSIFANTPLAGAMLGKESSHVQIEIWLEHSSALLNPNQSYETRLRHLILSVANPAKEPAGPFTSWPSVFGP